MAIILREIYSTDTVSDLIDKLNYNFDQIILNGGGIQGQQGIPGIGLQGIAGKDGSFWYYGNQHPSLLSTTYKTNDYFVLTSDIAFGLNSYLKGDVFNFDGTNWNFTTLNLRGEKGDDTSSTIGVFVQNANIGVVNMVDTATYMNGSELAYKPVIVGSATDQSGLYMFDAGSLVANDSNMIIYENSPNSNAELKLFAGPFDINGSNIYSPTLIATAPALTAIRRYTGTPSNNTGSSILDLVISNNSGGYIKTIATEIYLETPHLNVSGSNSRLSMELNNSTIDSFIKLNGNAKFSIYVSDLNVASNAKIIFDKNILKLESNVISMDSTTLNNTATTMNMYYTTLNLRNRLSNSDTIQLQIANNNNRTLRIKSGTYTASLLEYTLPNVSGYLLTNNSLIASTGILINDNSLITSTNNTVSISVDTAYLDATYYKKNGDDILNMDMVSLNSYKKSSIIHVSGSNPNIPISNTNGYQIFVFKFGNNIIQKALSMDNGNEYVRYSNTDGASWSIWKSADPFKVGTVFAIGANIAVSSFNIATGLGSGDWVGWAICDGRNGTIDARGRTLVGMSNPAYTAGNAESLIGEYHTLGNSGGLREVTLTANQSGLRTHTHNAYDSGHTHQVTISEAVGKQVGENAGAGEPGADDNVVTKTTTTSYANVIIQDSASENAIDAHENRQPFAVALYVQKIV